MITVGINLNKIIDVVDQVISMIYIGIPNIYVDRREVKSIDEDNVKRNFKGSIY